MASRNNFVHVVDPLKLAGILWPDVRFYDKQIEVIYSVMENDETYVVAGNQLGKDYVSGFIALWFFLTRTPCRVVTTSADYSQLESVLWGEIRRFIRTARYPLDAQQGGPLVVNHLHLRKVIGWGGKGADGRPHSGKTLDTGARLCPLSYCLGRVAAKGEGMLGHHIADIGDGVPRTLWISDEASGVDDLSYERASTWAKRMLAIGNPYPAGQNFFERGVKQGDVPARGVNGRAAGG